MEKKMNKADYEIKLNELCGALEDLVNSAKVLMEEAKDALSMVESLPELHEIEADEAED